VLDFPLNLSNEKFRQREGYGGDIQAQWDRAESASRFRFLFLPDLRANAFAFVAGESRYTLFRIML
jgi:hypothetical protein